MDNQIFFRSKYRILQQAVAQQIVDQPLALTVFRTNDVCTMTCFQKQNCIMRPKHETRPLKENRPKPHKK